MKSKGFVESSKDFLVTIAKARDLSQVVPVFGALERIISED